MYLLTNLTRHTQMENFPHLTETEFDEASRHLCSLLTHVNVLEYKRFSLVVASYLVPAAIFDSNVYTGLG